MDRPPACQLPVRAGKRPLTASPLPLTDFVSGRADAVGMLKHP
jgi:hypothetical protein